jgi:GNAT superfamily N-acetyltransferase
MAELDPTPTLHRATVADAEAITELVAAAYRHDEPLIGRTPMPMRVYYADALRAHEMWVLVVDGRLVGVIELEPRGDHLWVENVAVLPPWQGRGFGRLLLRHAEVEADRLGLREIGLLTNERYADNIAIYTRYGYRETHRVPHQGTDLVFFRKQLRAGAG